MRNKPDLLDDAEWQHIDAMNERFPYLRASFILAASIPTDERYYWAMARLKTLPRTGCAFRGVPDEYVETIFEHIQDMQSISEKFARHAIYPWHVPTAKTMIDVHDLPEAIIHDFHRHDEITKAEKRGLEDSALKIILERDPKNMKQAFNLFEEGKRPAARWVKDLDYLQCMKQTLKYQVKIPKVRQKLEEFWDDAHEKPMKTEQGRKMIADLLKHKAALKIGL